MRQFSAEFSNPVTEHLTLKDNQVLTFFILFHQLESYQTKTFSLQNKWAFQQVKSSVVWLLLALTMEQGLKDF